MCFCSVKVCEMMFSLASKLATARTTGISLRYKCCFSFKLLSAYMNGCLLPSWRRNQCVKDRWQFIETNLAAKWTSTRERHAVPPNPDRGRHRQGNRITVIHCLSPSFQQSPPKSSNLFRWQTCPSGKPRSNTCWRCFQNAVCQRRAVPCRSLRETWRKPFAWSSRAMSNSARPLWTWVSATSQQN